VTAKSCRFDLSENVASAFDVAVSPLRPNNSRKRKNEA